MKDRSLEFHRRGEMRILGRERQSCPEEPPSIELALIVDYQHHFPFEYIVVCQATGYAWNIFVGLHLFELTGK